MGGDEGDAPPPPVAVVPRHPSGSQLPLGMSHCAVCSSPCVTKPRMLLDLTRACVT